MRGKYISLCLFLFGMASAQTTINFKGCTSLFEDVNYIFYASEALDSGGKKIYTTTPVNGEQSCGGLGTCEFKIQYNYTSNRWEFLADSGNGGFVNPYVIYFNSGGSSTAINPPSIEVGTWQENSAITEGHCSGSLTSTNSQMDGDLQTATLASSETTKNVMQLYPNPVVNTITISGLQDGKKYIIYNSAGQQIRSGVYQSKINVEQLASGMYLFIVETNSGKKLNFKFIKK